MPLDNGDPIGAGCILEKQKLRRSRKDKPDSVTFQKYLIPPKKFNTHDTSRVVLPLSLQKAWGFFRWSEIEKIKMHHLIRGIFPLLPLSSKHQHSGGQTRADHSLLTGMSSLNDWLDSTPSTLESLRIA